MAYMIAGPPGSLPSRPCPPNPDPDPTGVTFVTDEELIHKAGCLPPKPPRRIRLQYSSGRIVCLDCGAWVPGEVRSR